MRGADRAPSARVPGGAARYLPNATVPIAGEVVAPSVYWVFPPLTAETSIEPSTGLTATGTGVSPSTEESPSRSGA